MGTSVVFYSQFMEAASQLKRMNPHKRGVYELYPSKPPTQLSEDLLNAVQVHLEDGAPLEVQSDDSLDYNDYLKAAEQLAHSIDYFDFPAPSNIMVSPPSGTPDPSTKTLLQTEQYLRGEPMKITFDN